MSKKTIWKFALPGERNMHGSFTLEMPVGALPLHVALQNGQRQLWAVVDPEADKELRDLHLAGTGTPVPEDKDLSYLGTFFEGPFVWHLFDVV